MRITNKELWLEMYKAAERVRDLAAWNWMTEDDVFMVQDPDNEENTAFCSLMGANGEFHGLAIYRGWDGFRSYNDLKFSGDFESDVVSLNYGLMQDCWMVEFTEKDKLNVAGEAALKELGLKYKGKLNWLDITDRGAGFAPWYLEEEDVPFVTTCLNQFFEIAMRAEESDSFLHKPNPDYKEIDSEEDFDDDDVDEWLAHSDELLLKRVGVRQADGKIDWSDEFIDTAPFEEECLLEQYITPSIRAAALAKKLKQKEAAIMIGMMMIPQPIQEEEEDIPFFSCLTLFIQYGSNYIIGQQIDDLISTREKFEKSLLDIFEEIGFIPSQLVVNMPLFEDWLEKIADLLDIEVILNPEEEGFEDVFTSMIGMMDGLAE